MGSPGKNKKEWTNCTELFGERFGQFCMCVEISIVLNHVDSLDPMDCGLPRFLGHGVL